jgi:hypothetical protein
VRHAIVCTLVCGGGHKVSGVGNALCEVLFTVCVCVCVCVCCVHVYVGGVICAFDAGVVNYSGASHSS